MDPGDGSGVPAGAGSPGDPREGGSRPPPAPLRTPPPRTATVRATGEPSARGAGAVSGAAPHLQARGAAGPSGASGLSPGRASPPPPRAADGETEAPGSAPLPPPPRAPSPSPRGTAQAAAPGGQPVGEKTGGGTPQTWWQPAPLLLRHPIAPRGGGTRGGCGVLRGVGESLRRGWGARGGGVSGCLEGVWVPGPLAGVGVLWKGVGGVRVPHLPPGMRVLRGGCGPWSPRRGFVTGGGMSGCLEGVGVPRPLAGVGVPGCGHPHIPTPSFPRSQLQDHPPHRSRGGHQPPRDRLGGPRWLPTPPAPCQVCQPRGAQLTPAPTGPAPPTGAK